MTITKRLVSSLIIVSSAVVGICCNVIKTVLYYNLTQNVHTTIFDFRIIRNDGYISGLLSDLPFLVSLFQLTTLLLSLYLLLVASKKVGKVSCVYILSPWLMFAGFLGNAIDWFYRGYIIDYIKINIPYNNFYTYCEDCFIEIGSILLIILVLFKNDKIARVYKFSAGE